MAAQREEDRIKIPKFVPKHFVNTSYFREAANNFLKSGGFEGGGRYTQAPKYSKDWWDFWEEEERRCIYGYSVGGVKITGRHYFYLNYFPIKRTVGTGKAQRKVKDFPKFWVIDYDWFWYKEIARWGTTKEFVESLGLWKNPLNLDGGKHLGCLKTRRGGFSYKGACGNGVYNFNFLPNSKSYFFSGKPDYLEADGILNKVEDGLNHLNQFTDDFWLKNRHKRYSLYHQRASYIDTSDGNKEKGTMSEIMGALISDPDKARGKDAEAITLEEGGSFTYFKKVLAVSSHSMKEGGVVTGQLEAFGTGGEDVDGDLEGLATAFESPSLYDMLEFVNDWEEGYESTECGVFIPCYMVNPSYMDEDGNIDIAGAIEFEEDERDKKRVSKDPKELDMRLAESPTTPTEALLRISSNIFPVAEAKAQKQRILRNREIQGLYKHGKLVRTTTGLEFQISLENPPINYYPHKNSENLLGCITSIEDPIKGPGNKIAKGLYYITVDPFYKDEAEDLTSLGVIRVYRKRVSDDGTVVTPRKQCVAWFVGRPALSVFHETIFKMSEYWGWAMIQSEIGGGGQGIIDYARTKKKLHLLMSETIEINNKEVETFEKNRTIFMNISTEDKILGLTYYADYLRAIAGVTEDGHELWNIHFIFDLGLLDEIIKFTAKRNVDRISAEIVDQFVTKVDEINEEKKRKKGKKRRIIDSINNRNKSSLIGNIKIQDGELII